MTVRNVEKWADAIVRLEQEKRSLPPTHGCHLHLEIVDQTRQLGEQMARQALQAARDRADARSEGEQ